MPSNKEVIESFLRGEDKHSLNLHCIGRKLYSYSTCIAEKYNNIIILNKTKYSVTTSKHQTFLKRELDRFNYDYRYTVNESIPRGTSDLNTYEYE